MNHDGISVDDGSSMIGNAGVLLAVANKQTNKQLKTFKN